MGFIKHATGQHQILLDEKECFVLIPQIQGFISGTIRNTHRTRLHDYMIVMVHECKEDS